MKKHGIILIGWVACMPYAYSQPTAAHRLFVIKSRSAYQQQLSNDTDYRMAELHSMIPTLAYDLRYATANNFTKKQLYRNASYTFLRWPVAKALLQAQQELQSKGYGLKVFDAYRPYRITKRMWRLIQDDRYVANPAKGSGHNRGLAVDLTVIDIRTGKELDMGTGFDNFTDTAHQTFKDLPTTVLENRNLLLQTMQKYGFQPLSTEWWHFYWPNDKQYAVLDIPFKQLKKWSH